MLQLTVFTIFHELHNKFAIVREGTGYPSNRNPMGVLFSE